MAEDTTVTTDTAVVAEGSTNEPAPIEDTSSTTPSQPPPATDPIVVESPAVAATPVEEAAPAVAAGGADDAAAVAVADIATTVKNEVAAEPTATDTNGDQPVEADKEEEEVVVATPVRKPVKPVSRSPASTPKSTPGKSPKLSVKIPSKNASHKTESPRSPPPVELGDGDTGIARPTSMSQQRQQEGRERREQIRQKLEESKKWAATGYIDVDKLYKTRLFYTTDHLNLPDKPKLKPSNTGSSGGSSPIWKPNNTGRNFAGMFESTSPARLLSNPSPRAKKLAATCHSSPCKGEDELPYKVTDVPNNVLRSSRSEEDLQRSNRFAANKVHMEVFQWLSTSNTSSPQ